MTSDLSFYWSLKPFSDLSDFANLKNYKKIPDDWLVYITDIAGSTRAIEEGRYKEVNLVGVAVISAVKNACGKQDIPYVFGGDGASFVLPPSFDAAVKSALVGAQLMAKNQFSFDLRVKRISAKEVEEKGGAILLGRQRISDAISLASFAGGGLAVAEELVKTEFTDRYNVTALETPVFSFEGLECRWDPISSKRGEFLTAIVRVLEGDSRKAADIFHALSEDLKGILGQTRSELITADNSTLAITKNPLSLRGEQKVKSFGLNPWAALRSSFWILTETLFGFFLIGYSLRAFGADWGRYFKDVLENSDFWKFDDVLRFVVDVNPDQKLKLYECLERAKSSGEISYGIHSSSHALMTCLVENRQGGHVHFLDGGEGGYALAAKQLKSFVQERVSPEALSTV